MAPMANDHRNVTLAVPVDFPPFETPIDYRIPMHFTDWHAARFVRHDKMPESMLETSRAFRREFAARFGGREKEFWAEAELRILASLKWKEKMEALTPETSQVEQNGNGAHDVAPKKEDASNGASPDISATTAIRPVLHATRSRTSFSVNISPGPAIFAVHGPAALTTKWHDIHPFILELIAKYFPEEEDPIIRYFCHERRSWPDMGEPTTTTLTSNVVKTLAKAIGIDRA